MGHILRKCRFGKTQYSVVIYLRLPAYPKVNKETRPTKAVGLLQLQAQREGKVN